MEENLKKKKTILQAVGLETIFIGILILVIILVLNYLSILPLSRLNPTLFGFLPHLNRGFVTPNIDPKGLGKVPTPALDKNAPSNITATSKVSGYTITVKNKDKLTRLLTDWGVIDGNFNGGYGIHGSTADYPVKRITAVLTDKVQEVNQFVSKDLGVYSSSITTVKPQEMTVTIHITPKFLSDPKTNAGNLFDAQFLTTVYHLVHPQKKPGPMDSELTDILTDKVKNKINYFEIKKK